MILRALLPLLLLGACSAPAPDGAISIGWQAWGTASMLRVEPSGRVTATGPGAGAATTPAGYRRFADLLEPARGYANGTVPCLKPLAGELGPAMGKPVIATIRWEATGETVRIDLTCMQQVEPLTEVKNALDLARSWGRKAEPLAVPPADDTIEAPAGNAD